MFSSSTWEDSFWLRVAGQQLFISAVTSSCSNRGDSYPQPSERTAQPADLLQQKRTWTKNLVVLLLPNTTGGDGWKWGKRKEGRWSSAIPLCPVFPAMGLCGTGQHWWPQTRGTCATFPLGLWEWPNKGQLSIHKFSCTQLLHFKKLFIFHRGKLEGTDIFSNPLFLPLENRSVP